MTETRCVDQCLFLKLACCNPLRVIQKRSGVCWKMCYSYFSNLSQKDLSYSPPDVHH